MDVIKAMEGVKVVSQDFILISAPGNVLRNVCNAPDHHRLPVLSVVPLVVLNVTRTQVPVNLVGQDTMEAHVQANVLQIATVVTLQPDVAHV